jgi:hypothetical protein
MFKLSTRVSGAAGRRFQQSTCILENQRVTVSSSNKIRVVLHFENCFAQHFRGIDEQLKILEMARVRHEIHVHTREAQFVALRRLVKVETPR